MSDVLAEIPSNFWQELSRLDVDLSSTLRGRLAQLWAERAQNEHASVASFDRFALGLLAVAAPPELVHDAHVAALDEIRHARLCFALASAYGNQALGPGPLDLSGTLSGGWSLDELCEATVIEGCVGETLAALEAAECAVQARAPAVRIALEIISADETRHAELAWAFVRWATEQAPELRARVQSAFRAAAVHLGPPKFACVEPGVLGHGFLEPESAHAVRQRGLTDVVLAAAGALGYA